MCMFSGEVKVVADTKIFARSSTHGHQFLVYSMALDSPTEVAMILPLPTPPNPGETAVRFLNLEKYADYFDDMEKGFPQLWWGTFSLGDAPWCALGALEVHQVGNYEASFVPSENDFHRLDARFRLPAGAWAQLPLYHDYGFAVFKLKAGAQTVHPMAFDFPRRNPSRLFFPTVHIHDGKVHKTATFDHTLYCQKPEADRGTMKTWHATLKTASDFMNMEKADGIVAPDERCFKMRIEGRQANTDIYA